MEANQESLKTGSNQFLKETTQTQKKLRLESAAATPESASTATLSTAGGDTMSLPLAPAKGTRRRRTKQMASSLKQLQINNTNYVELSFD